MLSNTNSWNRITKPRMTAAMTDGWRTARARFDGGAGGKRLQPGLQVIGQAKAFDQP
jgi:hypothetical protein